VGERADHDAVHVAREHAGRVLDGLAPADLDVAGREEQRVPAELERPHLERDAGAGAALGEDHAQRLAGERAVGIRAPLHQGGQVEQGADLSFREIRDGQKVTFRHAKAGK
jgi:hypothetical protein